MKRDLIITSDNNHEFKIQGAKILVYETGQGSPVLFLHGSPDSHDICGFSSLLI